MLTADSQVIDKIVGLAETKTFPITDKHGKESQYSTEEIHEVIAAAPALPVKVSTHTLSGFVELIREKLDADQVDLANVFIHVVDHSKVQLCGKATDQWGRRLCLIEATPVPFEQFKFGEWIPQENFCIGVASKFGDTPDKEYVLQMAGSLTGQGEKQNTDDGFTQRVVVKQGMKVPESVTLKPRVELAPFRIFPECNQPVSPFVFRCKQSDNGPLLMLVEADGGFWKVAAMKIVQQYIDILLTPSKEGALVLPIEVIA
jgi:hypothetical protein